MNSLANLLVVIILSTVTGCSLLHAENKAGNTNAAAASAGAETNAPIDEAFAHKIMPLEEIVIIVVGEKDLSQEVRVQANGKITYPMLGELEIAGMTVSQCESLLRERLAKDYLVDPQVNVLIRKYRERFIYVNGEVIKPGPIPLPGEQKWTILDALGQAGGPTKAAAVNRIEFTRGGVTKTFNFKKLKLIKDIKQHIILEPGDTVFVPQARF